MREKNYKRKISFSPPDIANGEVEAVKKALRSGWITTGPRTKTLEKKLAEYVGTNCAVCLNSGTAAEELIFRILGVGEGDEVIVPAYTYTATASAALHVGANVVFVDSQSDCVEMDYDALATVITEKTKAIVPVDLGGVMCDYEKIFKVVESKRSAFRPGGTTELGRKIQTALGRIVIVADDAHALGAKKRINDTWHMAGDIADFTSFSFHAVKNFTTAEGGAATWRKIQGVDDEEIYKFFQLYSLHGQDKDALAKTQLGSWEYDIIGPWYKCNMTDIMAAIGLKQLERYSKLLEKRRSIIEQYDAACDELGVEHLIHYTDDMISSGHLYITRIPGITDEQRRGLIVAMAEKGVACNVHYKPLPLMSAYKALGMDPVNYPNAVKLYENEVTLPLHTLLTNEDVEYVIASFREAVQDIEKLLRNEM